MSSSRSVNVARRDERLVFEALNRPALAGLFALGKIYGRACGEVSPTFRAVKSWPARPCAATGVSFCNRDRGASHDAAPPTPPDIRVRIRRFGGLSGHLFPQEGWPPGGWKRTTARTLRSLLGHAVGLHLSALTCRTDITACLPHGVFELRVSTSHFQPLKAFGRIAPPYYALC